MVDPERTSPDVSSLAFWGATRVLIRIGSLPSLALVPVVPPSSPSSLLQAAMPRRKTITSTVKAVLTLDHGLKLSAQPLCGQLTRLR
jgi:hypothetical protein